MLIAVLLPASATEPIIDPCEALWQVILDGDQLADPIGHLDDAGWIFPSTPDTLRQCGLEVEVGNLSEAYPQATLVDLEEQCVYAPLPAGTEAPLANSADLIYLAGTNTVILKLQCFKVTANLSPTGSDVRPYIYYGTGVAGAFLREFEAEIAAPGGTDSCYSLIGAGYRECKLRESGLDLDHKLRCYAVAGTMQSWIAMAAQDVRNPTRCTPVSVDGTIGEPDPRLM